MKVTMTTTKENYDFLRMHIDNYKMLLKQEARHGKNELREAYNDCFEQIQAILK